MPDPLLLKDEIADSRSARQFPNAPSARNGSKADTGMNGRHESKFRDVSPVPICGQAGRLSPFLRHKLRLLSNLSLGLGGS
jgi:hypothetical protein